MLLHLDFLHFFIFIKHIQLTGKLLNLSVDLDSGSQKVINNLFDDFCNIHCSCLMVPDRMTQCLTPQRLLKVSPA